MQFAVILYLLLFTLLGTATLHAEIYYWIDDKGVKHYSNVPPTGKNDVKVKFKEQEFDAAADQQRAEADQKEMQALIKEVEAEEKQAQAEQERQDREKPLSREEKIELEKKRLLDKIAMLEAQPLDRFGSQRNKIVTIGYYKYRLEALAKDPDKYFKEPVPFEGNVKYPE